VQDFPSQVDNNELIKNFLLLRNQKVYHCIHKCLPWALFWASSSLWIFTH